MLSNIARIIRTGSLLPAQIGGLLTRRPLLAVLFFIAAFSLAGIPPSSGFVSKLGLLQIALDTRHWLIAGVSLVVSLLTLMSMVRLWQAAFTGPVSQPHYPTTPLADPRRRWLTLAPIGILVALSLAIGIFSGPVYELSATAARQVMDRAGYIADVGPLNEIPVLEGKD